MNPLIPASATPALTAVLLAGGRGSRMGGVDKGLQTFKGRSLTENALERLRAQSLPVQTVLINANRNVRAYGALGACVVPDPSALPPFAGPLAGFLAGLAHCHTPLLLTVPCDVPRFPLSLCKRMTEALQDARADIALAAAPETDHTGATRMHIQPVFCLMRTHLRESLMRFMHEGGRKIALWAALHHQIVVPFTQPDDDPQAFANLNTLDELRRLEQQAACPPRSKQNTP